MNNLGALFNQRKRVLTSFVFLVLLSISGLFPVFAANVEKIPASLEQWKGWVMYDNEQYACPSLYNDFNEHRCIWPELLNLDFSSDGGSFKQRITVMADSWCHLPGDKKYWPHSVTVDGEIQPVLFRESKPAVKLSEGKHIISGTFKWTTIPQAFSISKNTGLVALRVNNKVVNEPFIDKTGKLWIQKKAAWMHASSSKESNIITTQIFRLIEDAVPLQIKTIVRIKVSGGNRREKLIGCIPENVSTVSVKTALPVKLIENGTLLVNVRPGMWEISLLSVISDPEYQFKPASALYGEELWAYKPNPALRLARVEGVTPVDPAQSSMPSTWKHFSTYLVKKGDVVSIKEIQRGASDFITDTLHLQREIWLDFDGSGATVKDNITGVAGKRQFFSMKNGKYDLGRVSMDNEDKLVTIYDGSSGVEIERGRVDLMAVSRMKKVRAADAFSLGWESDFKTAKGILNLPPGWRLLGLKGGAAEYRATWIDSWSLLDFFLVLVVALAVTKLFRRFWGALFFIGLILIAHEKGAPFYLWLVLTATTAILRVVHASKLNERSVLFYRGMRFFHYAALLVLTVICFIFVTNQIRIMIYPQLESVRAHREYNLSVEHDAFPSVQESAIMQKVEKRVSKRDALRGIVGERKVKKSSIEQRNYQMSQQNIVTQTGPGIPSWAWRKIQVNFGAVSASHKIKFWLTSPLQNGGFSAVRVIFLILMLYRIANVKLSRYLRKNNLKAVSSIFLVLFVISLTCPDNNSSAGELPSSELLLELEKRLTEPSDCFPQCAAINDVEIILPKPEVIKNKKQFLEILLTVNSAVKTAVPLPLGSGNWQLYDLALDNKPHLAVISEGDTLWTYVPKGVHVLKLRGIAYDKTQFQFLFPLKPAYVGVEADGWNISGINDKHQVEKVVQANFKKLDKEKSVKEKTTGAEKHLLTYLRVKRKIILDLEWTVITTVERFVRSKKQQNVVIDIPLLKNELIRTESTALSVDNGKATISMPSQDNKVEWESSIPISPQIILVANEDPRLSEQWELKYSLLWHSSFKGIPVTYPEGNSGSFWYPWPGETLTLSVSKLESAPGKSITIDSVRADYHIGKGYNRILLNAKIRTTSGRTHNIKSPVNAIVEHIVLNGLNFPIVGNSETISLPLQPGTQSVEIEWNESQKWSDSLFKSLLLPKKIKLPEIDVGGDLNNIDVYFHLPEKLWLLLAGGPQLGPAVLAWSMIGAVLIISLVLGRLRFSPLTAMQWMVLGLGLISLSVPEMILVAVWFFVIEIRKNHSVSSPFLFNLCQTVLVIWTVFIVLTCIKAISNGLIGVPDMQISGNFSNANSLHWTLDHSENFLPQPWVLTYSIYIYQLVMLAWALWLSLNTIKWSKWCIVSLKSDAFWKKTGLFKKKGKVASKDNS